MREIKFRAWVRFDSGNYGILDHENLLDWTLREILDDEGTDVLMQFTGLLDKNGKEIYEGDIVTEDGKGAYGVEWDEGLWTLSCYGGRPWHELGRIEIIGNIYENPELLTNN